MNFFSLLFPCVVMTFIMLLKALLSVQLCYCGCSCWASSCSCSAGPVWTSNRRKDLPKGFRAESWLNVWFLVYLRVEMCLVWSWFCLSFNFFFELARWCYCYLFRWSACLFIWASSSFFFCWDFYVASTWVHRCSERTRPSLLSAPPTPLSSTQSLSPTHPNALDHTQNLTSDPLTPPRLPLFALLQVCCLTYWLTFLFSYSHGKPVSRLRALTVKQTA